MADFPVRHELKHVGRIIAGLLCSLLIFPWVTMLTAVAVPRYQNYVFWVWDHVWYVIL